jgi:hypothetical protein
MLHVGEGTPGEYGFPDRDLPTQNASGQIVVQPFQVNTQ